MDWFLYESGLRHERVEALSSKVGSELTRNHENIFMCDAMRDLIPFVQFKKREKHP